MMIRKNILIVLSLTAIIVTSACGGRGTPDIASTLAPMYTAAAQTLQALTTQVAVTPNMPYQTLTPTSVLPTLTPTIPPTSVPNTPVPVSRCDWAYFVGDVSVPDGSSFAPSTAFTKTWRLKNIGTCTWTTAYALVFSSGLPMGGPAAVNLPVNVAPGQIADLSISLTASSSAGHYRGYWMLQNPSGIKFGIGNQANAAFWVDINVAASGLNVTTTTINADNPDPSTPGQAVAVNVSVSGSGTTPTGTVAITGADTNCTITLVSGSGSCNVVFNTTGAKTLTAAYSGDANYASSSDTESHTVSTGTAVTTTTITADTPDPSTPGQAVAVSVTVSGAGIAPTGTVAITGADTNCNITLAGGSGSCSVVFTTVGAKTLTATYSGNVNYSGSSGTTSHTVSQASTTTTITADTPDPSAPFQSVAVSVTVSGAGVAPTGTVTITGADTSCTITLSGGSGSCNVVFNTTGAKTLTATYGGDVNYTASSGTASHTVNNASTTTITTINPEPSTPGQSVTVNVTVNGAGDTPTGTVAITGADINCTITLGAGGSGSCATVKFNTAGAKILTATYSGDANYASSSGTANHTVIKGSTTTTITTINPEPSNLNDTVTVVVTVISISGSGVTPSGTVAITGADTNCTFTLSGGSGSCNVVFRTSGNKTLTATYSGDVNYESSSDTESHTVN
jgi:hypothetical protein